LFVATLPGFTTFPVNPRLNAQQAVYLGQDLFLTLCYEEGGRPFQGKVKTKPTVYSGKGNIFVSGRNRVGRFIATTLILTVWMYMCI